MAQEMAEAIETHSLRFLEMAFRADRRVFMDRADGCGKKTGVCGDTIEFFIQIRDNRLTRMSYRVDGCIFTNACANAVAELAEGSRLEDAWEISPETVADYLETLPADHFHCAELAVGALYLALSDHQARFGKSWKRLYR